MLTREAWARAGADPIPSQINRVYERFKRGLMPQSEFFVKMDRLLAGKSVGSLTWEHGVYPKISLEWLEENRSRVSEILRLHDIYDRLSSGIEAIAWGETVSTTPPTEGPEAPPTNASLADDYSKWLEGMSELDAAYLTVDPKVYFLEGQLAKRPAVMEDGSFRMAKTDEDFEAFVGAWVEALQRLVAALKDFALAHDVVP